MSQLPKAWGMASLEEIGMPSTVKIVPAKFKEEVFDLFSVPSFFSNAPEEINGASIGSSKQNVMPSDVLLCKIVPHINRVWVVPDSGSRRQMASSEWIVIRNPNMNAHYLRYCLSAPEFREAFLSDLSGIGGSLTRARPKTVGQILIPVPPYSEQCRIASKLDSLLARTQKARNELARIPMLVEHYKQAILAAAFRGDLTAG